MGSSEPGLLLHQPEGYKDTKGKSCACREGVGEKPLSRYFIHCREVGGLEVGGASELLSIWGGAEALESF